ncbi:Rodlet protein [Escovopsis weberi]|uniref:Hydrophobin n=1 Tax=Escovopsis weberi TaxID=150374 RepID=A0A0N0RT33_ESCWE|nr:Rodlet protein [Escovopsis weberi]
MQFFAVVALLAAAAAAAPEIRAKRAYPSVGEVPVNVAQQSCGSDLELNCCDKVDASTKSQNGGGLLDLSNLLGGQGGLQLFDQCSPLSVTGIIGVSDLLNNHCKQQAACCQGTKSEANGGLVNLALPCIALADLIA